MTRDSAILTFFLIKIHSLINMVNALLGQKDTGVGERVLGLPGFASNSLQKRYE